MNDNEDILKGIGAVILILVIQAIIVALMVSFIWTIFLQFMFNLQITIFQWFGIILCFNLIRFNIIELMIKYQNKEEKENEVCQRNSENNS